jgi:hypothetical protein
MTLLTIQKVNPDLGNKVNLFSKAILKLTGWLGSALLILFLIIHLHKDLKAEVSVWYIRSTWIYLFVMATGALIFALHMVRLKR